MKTSTDYRRLEGLEVAFFDPVRGGHGVGRVDEVALDRHRQVKFIRVLRPRLTPAGRATYAEAASQKIALQNLRLTSHPCGVLRNGAVVALDEFLGTTPQAAAPEAAESETDMSTKKKTDTPARKRTTGPGGKRMARAKAPRAERGPSLLDAAHQILNGRETPMTAKDLVAAATERGLWKPAKGKTPDATLSAAIGREIKEGGEGCRFKRPGPGLFAAA